MSKKNKHTNKNKYNHSQNHNHNYQKSTGVVSEQSQGEEQSPITLDKHLEQMELQSMNASSSDAVSTTMTTTEDVVPEDVTAEETSVEEKGTTSATHNAQKVTEGEVQSVLNWKMFLVGLAIGAIVTSFLL